MLLNVDALVGGELAVRCFPQSGGAACRRGEMAILRDTRRILFPRALRIERLGGHRARAIGLPDLPGTWRWR